MTAYEFTLIVDRDPTEVAYSDALFEADHGGSVPEGGPDQHVVHVARTADSLMQAVLSAVATVESTGLVVTGVQSDDLVTLKDIAYRTGRSYESVRLLAQGKRGPGAFPRPASPHADKELYGWVFYSWVEVSQWFDRNYTTTLASDYEQELAAANHMVKAHQLGGHISRRKMQKVTRAWDALHGNTPRRSTPHKKRGA